MTSVRYLLLALAVAAAGCSTTPSATKPVDQGITPDQALIARMEARLAHDIEAYKASLPKKQFVSSRSESRFTEYVRQWAAKIESVGNANYPDEARGRLYGSVLVVVTLRPDGSVQSAEIDRSSGHEVLDRAALRIVQLASPFAPFPPEIRKDTDLLVITRTWYFSRGDKMAGEERP